VLVYVLVFASSRYRSQSRREVCLLDRFGGIAHGTHPAVGEVSNSLRSSEGRIACRKMEDTDGIDSLGVAVQYG